MTATSTVKTNRISTAVYNMAVVAVDFASECIREGVYPRISHVRQTNGRSEEDLQDGVGNIPISNVPTHVLSQMLWIPACFGQARIEEKDAFGIHSTAILRRE